MSKSVERYKILISAPSDIKIEDEIRVIKEAIGKFNSIVGDKYNIVLLPKYWKDDAFPEMGDTPQNLLNKQIVEECDAIIAIFWTRFGTPTEHYDSGTEEEIMLLKQAGKQIFLYFCNREIKPDQFEKEQYDKVKEFKEKHKKDSIYFEYDTTDNLSGLLDKHITKYFLTLEDGVTAPVEQNTTSNHLQLLSFHEGEAHEELILLHSLFSELKSVRDSKKTIIELVQQIDKIHVPKVNTNDINIIQQNSLSQRMGFPFVTYAIIGKHAKENILRFMKDNDLIISDELFNTGSLQIVTGLGINSFSTSSKYQGSDIEKQKYEILTQISESIDDYYSKLDYFSKLDKMISASLVLTNKGTIKDTNIGVNLILPGNKFIKPGQMPIPELHFLKEINEKKSILRYFVTDTETHNVNRYQDYLPAIPEYNSIQNIGLLNKSKEENIKLEKQKYLKELSRLFDYKIHKHNGKIIVKTSFKSLMHNTSVFFPSKLYFKEEIEEIEYEIISERSNGVIRGKLSTKN